MRLSTCTCCCLLPNRSRRMEPAANGKQCSPRRAPARVRKRMAILTFTSPQCQVREKPPQAFLCGRPFGWPLPARSSHPCLPRHDFHRTRLFGVVR